MNSTAQHLALASVDDYLGPSDKRFFAAGYRRAEHTVECVSVTAADAEAPGVSASVTVDYPSDWSKKKDEIDIPPHLSSIDVLVLAAQLAEAHLTHAFGLDDRQRAALRLRRVRLSAGSTPQEELADLPAEARLLSTRPLDEEPGTCLSVYDCRIGQMRARCEVEHVKGAAAVSEATFGSLEDLLGPAGLRYYGTGFTRDRQHIDTVRADLTELSAGAGVTLSRAPETPPATAGVEGMLRPAPSMVDCFVTNLQLAQILMYEMDAVRRSDSNTLWMLRTVLDSSKAGQPPAEDTSLPLHTRVTGKHLLPLRGGIWRNVEIAGAFGGISLRCSLAHELPPAAAATAV
ncbi:AvrD family protein [Streptomyces sp. NBC_00893]|uniref:AvrD family protein n=1 Tax=Streptomyces sp. NBC_00893 TaxID=2975862 RepID=UPI002254ACA1|nr:AvrD family protein [Streptomyces sp. NBC_00893]MCX4844623.1 AvrD family protein [Streptomyces sp. NBC_00893]